MKRLKRVSIVVLLCSTALLIGFLVHERMNRDGTPPVITCPDGQIAVSIRAPEEELLTGVTAYDEKSGDVTDAVVVEKLSSMKEDGTRTITYAVVDQAGNVGRAQHEMRYTDYEKPRFSLSDDLRFDMDTDVADLLSRVHASSSIDGDLTGKIKFIQTDDTPFFTEGFKEVELRITDSTGTTAVLPVTVERYHREANEVELPLTQYLVYLKQGAFFDPQRYCTQSGENLTVEGKVDTRTPGVYQVDYLLKDGSNTGRSRLIVVVEERGTEGAA